MVQSKAPDVATYLAEVPADRREALTRLRDLCLQELPGFTEVLSYGMPAYERDGTGEVAFAGQKHYISFYLLRATSARRSPTVSRARTWAKDACAFAKNRTTSWFGTCCELPRPVKAPRSADPVGPGARP
ncbi:iron chaperone [Nocardia sp. NPDC056541]|uniref:iron chaperone n=1 Tax=Nocardia sp. NPDC056541 TaxID=3345860 RepID=UPI0036727801